MINKIDSQPINVYTWKGYTFEELRYRRAINIARIEIEKERLKMFFTDKNQTKSDSTSSNNILKHMFDALSIIDYIKTSVTLWQKLKDIFNKFNTNSTS